MFTREQVCEGAAWWVPMVISFLWCSWDNLLSTQVFSQINAEPCVLPGLQLPDNFLDTFIVSYDFRTFIACWKQISADFRFHVPAWARMWLWRSGCHPPSVSSQRAWPCPQQPKPGSSAQEFGDSWFGDSIRAEKWLKGWFCPQNKAFLSFLSLIWYCRLDSPSANVGLCANTPQTICSKADFAAIKKVYRLRLFLSWSHFNSSFPSNFTDFVGFFSLMYSSPEGNCCFEEEQIFFMIFFSNAKSNSPLGKASNGKLWPAQIKGDPIYSGRILWELQMKTAI